MAFDWGSLISGGLKLGAELLGSNKSSKSASAAAAAATPTPYGVQGPAGGFAVDPNTQQIQLSMAQNPFAQIFNSLGASSFANAAVAPGQYLYGVNPEVAAAYQGTFGQGLTSEIQSQLDLLRQAAAPEENRARLGLDDQLFARGQLGTTGGAERFRALQESMNQADLQRQLSAVGMGQTNALNRLQGATGATQLGMGQQLQNFNIGQGAFGGLQGLFNNLMQQGQLGVSAGGGTPAGIAQWAAQQAQGPYQAGYNFLNQSGAFDKLGSWLGGLFGGGSGATPGINPGAPAPGQGGDLPVQRLWM